MIYRNKVIKVPKFKKEYVLKYKEKNNIYEKAIFLDLEHYVYKHPICIGVFGACYYSKEDKSIHFTQFMIESGDEKEKIIHKSFEYLQCMKNKFNKEYIVTFSGNNDYTVIEYLFKENHIPLNIRTYMKSIDLQKCYEKEKKICIGLKNLEKVFNIERKGEVISGVNLAKTIKKIVKDESYFFNMGKEKRERILIYNEQDVINLFYIYINWYKYMKNELL